jgi:hypothetical protein
VLPAWLVVTGRPEMVITPAPSEARTEPSEVSTAPA